MHGRRARLYLLTSKGDGAACPVLIHDVIASLSPPSSLPRPFSCAAKAAAFGCASKPGGAKPGGLPLSLLLLVLVLLLPA